MPEDVTASKAEDGISAIDTLIFEHDAIRHHMRTLNRIAKEEEELFLEVVGGWRPAQLEAAKEKQVNLDNYLINLHEGVSRHEALEGRTMPSLVGDLVMEGFWMEHRELREQLGKVENLLSLKGIGQLGPEQLGKRAVELRFVLDYLRKLLESHLTGEETVLGLVKKVLERNRSKAS